MSARLEIELAEQPEALARLLERQTATANDIAKLFGRPDVQYVLIASRGSSSNAARYAQYLLGRAHRIPVAFATPSLYTLYEQPPRLDGALVVGISQSGASPDVNAVIAEARRQGRPTVAITNESESPLAAASEAVLPLEAGSERAVAATKTYVNSLGAIALLFSAATGQGRAELERVPEQLAAQIEQSRTAVEALEPARRRNGRGARRQLRHVLRDRAQDPRAVGLALRGVLGRRPDARAGGRDRAGVARPRGRADGAGARVDARGRQRRRAARART